MTKLSRSPLLLLERPSLDLLSEAGPLPNEAARVTAAANTGLGFIHFSDLNKLGINPRTKYGTPAGIYGYLLSQKSLPCVTYASTEDYVRARDCGIARFATDRKFIHVGAVKDYFANKFKVLQFEKDGSSNLSQEELEIALDTLNSLRRGPAKDVKLLSRQFIDDSDEVIRRAKKSYAQNNGKGQFLWSLTMLASRNPVAWGSLMLRLGIVAVIDKGSATIHPNEPAQMVVFRGDAIDHVYVGYNKMSVPVEDGHRHSFLYKNQKPSRMYKDYLIDEKRKAFNGVIRSLKNRGLINSANIFEQGHTSNFPHYELAIAGDRAEENDVLLVFAIDVDFKLGLVRLPRDLSSLNFYLGEELGAATLGHNGNIESFELPDVITAKSVFSLVKDVARKLLSIPGIGQEFGQVLRDQAGYNEIEFASLEVAAAETFVKNLRALLGRVLAVPEQKEFIKGVASQLDPESDSMLGIVADELRG